jgi:DNA-binding winged helix-turn-helix (wHTH) protein
MQASFGEFIADFDQRRLFAANREIRLTPKGFELLRLLIENRPKALKKDEIFARLWPDTFVTENNLATLVAELRSALDDDPHEPRFIRTVYAYGYAFAGEAAEQHPVAAIGELPSAWSLIHDHREIALRSGENIVGRAGPGVVVFDSPTISRHHARITIAGDRAVVEDLGSKNGTWVGPLPVTEPTAVRDGHELRFGSVLVVVRCGGHQLSTETVARSGPGPRPER